MLHILSLSTLLIQEPMPDLESLTKVWLKDIGFTSKFLIQDAPGQPSSASLVAENQELKLQLTVSTHAVESRNWTSLREPELLTNAALNFDQDNTPSTIAFGSSFLWHEYVESYSAMALVNGIHVQASLSDYRRDEQGFRINVKHSAERKLWVERAARLTAAVASGLDQGSLNIRQVANRNIPSVVSTRTKQIAGDLNIWTTLRGWSMERAQNSDVIVLKRRQDVIRVPIGAHGVVINGKWRPSSGSVIYHQGKWWMPESSLKIIAELG
jgi:hypothetical protein